MSDTALAHDSTVLKKRKGAAEFICRFIQSNPWRQTHVRAQEKDSNVYEMIHVRYCDTWKEDHEQSSELTL